MMGRPTCVALLTTVTTFAWPVAAFADGDGDGAETEVSFKDVVVKVAGDDGSDASDEADKQVKRSGKKVEYEPYCANKLIDRCGRPVECATESGSSGVLYDLKIDGKMAEEGTCIGPAEARAAAVVTPGDVLTAFRRLHWPASKLSIQPPDGVTLVNFETNFYTDDTAAITKTVRLLGQRVRIEATPSSFTFHFGDDLKLESTDPGAPYPRLRVTHSYLRKDTYRPWLSTTYSGRFRVGHGRWQDIPGTVTIDGPKQRLRAIEASPKLVGY